jgi:hypothetical protein
MQGGRVVAARGPPPQLQAPQPSLQGDAAAHMAPQYFCGHCGQPESAC